MNTFSPLRPYTAEMRLVDQAGAPLVDADHGSAALAQARHREIMETLAGVGAALARIAAPIDGQPIAEPAPKQPETAQVKNDDPENAAVTGVYDHVDIKQLLLELGELSFAISETKREIAALRQRNAPPEALGRATDELDEVVQATERATETILSAAERVDALVGVLRAASADGANSATIDEIGEQVIAVFEACNFQDITGQRITKVVNTMKFVEDRIDRMMQVLGGPSAFANIEVVEEHVDEDAKLLQGPALADESKISQNDIDAFFN